MTYLSSQNSVVCVVYKISHKAVTSVIAPWFSVLNSPVNPEARYQFITPVPPDTKQYPTKNLEIISLIKAKSHGYQIDF